MNESNGANEQNPWESFQKRVLKKKKVLKKSISKRFAVARVLLVLDEFAS